MYYYEVEALQFAPSHWRSVTLKHIRTVGLTGQHESVSSLLQRSHVSPDLRYCIFRYRAAGAAGVAARTAQRESISSLKRSAALAGEAERRAAAALATALECEAKVGFLIVLLKYQIQLEVGILLQQFTFYEQRALAGDAERRA